MNNILRIIFTFFLLASYTLNGSAQFQSFETWSEKHFGEVITSDDYEKGIRDFIRHWENKQYLKSKNEDADSINTLLDKALNLYPTHSGLHELKGLFHILPSEMLLAEDEARYNATADAKYGEKLKGDTVEVINACNRARYHLIKAIEMDDRNDNARRLMLKVETWTGHYSSAITYCNELLESSPYNLELWRKKIFLYHANNNDAEAIKCLERIMSIYPENSQLRKDYADLKEASIKHLRKSRQITEEENALRKALEMSPKTPRYYYYLANLLSRTGRAEEAAEMAGMGTDVCKDLRGDTIMEVMEYGKPIIVDSHYLAKMKGRILSGLNRHAEAFSYLSNLYKDTNDNTYKALRDSLRDTWAQDAAVSSHYNDPYEANARSYALKKDHDVREYLISTAIKRGYDEDALLYIQDAIREQQRTNADTTLLVLKKYNALKRLGRYSKAYDVLKSMYQDGAKMEYTFAYEYLNMRLDQGRQEMDAENYYDAVPYFEEVYNLNKNLIFVTKEGSKGNLVQENFVEKYESKDKTFFDLQLTAAQRLYNCMMKLKRYDEASLWLEKQNGMSSVRYYAIRKASVSASNRQYKDALKILADELKTTAGDAIYQSALRNAYCEIATKYVKELMDAHRLKDADNILAEALKICPDDYDLNRYGINCASALYEREKYKETPDSALRQKLADRIANACKACSNDSYFEVKKAQLEMADLAQVYEKFNKKLRKEEQEEALVKYKDIAVPLDSLLNIYYDDEALTNTYAECYDHIFRYATKQRNVNYEELDSIADLTLEKCPDNPTLLYWKGRINERLKNWELAYAYGKQAKAYDGDEQQFGQRMDNIQSRLTRNSLTAEYQYSRPSSEDYITSNAYLSYSHTFKKKYNNPFITNTLNVGIAYAGRDGSAISDPANMTRGGTGIQLSAGWAHRFSRLFSLELYGGASTRHFPLVTAKVRGSFDLGNDWQITATFSYRRMKLYEGMADSVMHEAIVEDPDKDPGNEKDINKTIRTLVPEYYIGHWNSYYKNMFQLGVGASKTISNFHLSANCDVLYFNDKLHVNGQLKVQFFPWETNRSNFFISGGLGNAPDLTYIDNASESGDKGYGKLNTFVSLGGVYYINHRVGLALSGSWYTMDRDRLMINGDTGEKSITYEFSNRFYLNASLIINF